MLTKNAAPSDKVLGTVFGLSSLAGCLARIVSPALARFVIPYLLTLFLCSITAGISAFLFFTLLSPSPFIAQSSPLSFKCKYDLDKTLT